VRRLRTIPGAVVVAAAGLLTLLTAAPALAHTTHDAGPYKITFGWEHEPTYTGAENAVQVFIHDAKGAALDDLGSKGLTVRVTAANQTSDPLALTSAFDPDTGLGTHGEFDAPLTPTSPGTYTFHITGDINGTAVDVSDSSSDKTFANVEDPTTIEFPAKTQTNQQLSTAVTTLQSRLSAAQSAAASAKSSASSARTLAVVAIVVAVVLAVIAMARGRRKAA
jgi:hypothetical protein